MRKRTGLLKRIEKIEQQRATLVQHRAEARRRWSYDPGGGTTTPTDHRFLPALRSSTDG
jgi:hypothetical protein